jgi:hypothetical protein
MPKDELDMRPLGHSASSRGLSIKFAFEQDKPRHQPSIKAEQIKDLPILEGFGL